MTLLAIATVLTLWSGYLYFSDYFGWRRTDVAEASGSKTEGSKA